MTPAASPSSLRQRLARWVPCLAWPRPSAALLRNEAMAGITVALMVIPQGVAYAALAGMPLVTGVYAALFPALIAVMFSSSQRLSVGPTALTSLLVGASLAPLAVAGSAEWVAMAVWLTLMSGAIQIVLGAGRFGWLLRLVNSPVLIGFTQGAAVLIAISQLPALLGFTGRTIPQVLQGGPLPDLVAIAFGLGSVAVLWLGKRLLPRFPTTMALVAGAAAISWLVNYALRGGAVVGSLPSGLPSLYWPGLLPLGTFSALVLPALMITLVSFLETASSAKVDNARAGTLWNENQDLIGQGLAKLASGFTGAFPTSSSFSRSAITLYAGAQTGWATLFSVVVVAGALLWLMPLLYHVPQAVLAAVVVTAILGLVKPASFKALWRVSRIEAGIAFGTFVLTIATAPSIYWGVLGGLLASMAHYMYRHLHPRIIEVGLHPDGSLRDRHLWKLPPLAPHLYALRIRFHAGARAHGGAGRAARAHRRVPVRAAHQPRGHHRRRGVRLDPPADRSQGRAPAPERPEAAGHAGAGTRRVAGARVDALQLPHRRRGAGRADAAHRRAGGGSRGRSGALNHPASLCP
jgi:SulP family sulfate permease